MQTLYQSIRDKIGLTIEMTQGQLKDYLKTISSRSYEPHTSVITCESGFFYSTYIVIVKVRSNRFVLGSYSLPRYYLLGYPLDLADALEDRTDRWSKYRQQIEQYGLQSLVKKCKDLSPEDSIIFTCIFMRFFELF